MPFTIYKIKELNILLMLLINNSNNNYFSAEVSSGKKMKSKAMNLLSIKSALKEECVCGNNCLRNIDFKTIRAFRNSYWLNSRTVRMQLLKYYISQSKKTGKFRFLTIEKWTLCSRAFRIVHRINKNTFSRAMKMDKRNTGQFQEKIREICQNILCY